MDSFYRPFWTPLSLLESNSIRSCSISTWFIWSSHPSFLSFLSFSPSLSLIICFFSLLSLFLFFFLFLPLILSHAFNLFYYSNSHISPSDQPVDSADYVIPVNIDNVFHNVFVLKRPGLDDFMRRVGEVYEVRVRLTWWPRHHLRST